MPYLTVQEIETIAERIVRAYHRYCAQQNQTVTVSITLDRYAHTPS